MGPLPKHDANDRLSPASPAVLLAPHSPLISPKLLLLETSGRGGFVALAEGVALGGVRRLDEARRHARDLAPAAAELLKAQGWKARELSGVVVSRGPGSYTGLRVGVMSAKTLAYAVGCPLIGVETFAVIATQAPSGVNRLDVLADAQQEKVYVQPFERQGNGWRASGALAIRPFEDWLAGRSADAWATGSGLHRWAARLPTGTSVVEAALWNPQPESLLALGLAGYTVGERDDPFALEPLYLRPSSAEEQHAAQMHRA